MYNWLRTVRHGARTRLRPGLPFVKSALDGRLARERQPSIALRHFTPILVTILVTSGFQKISGSHQIFFPLGLSVFFPAIESFSRRSRPPLTVPHCQE